MLRYMQGYLAKDQQCQLVWHSCHRSTTLLSRAQQCCTSLLAPRGKFPDAILPWGKFPRVAIAVQFMDVADFRQYKERCA
jgi:hypothetical protein